MPPPSPHCTAKSLFSSASDNDGHTLISTYQAEGSVGLHTQARAAMASPPFPPLSTQPITTIKARSDPLAHTPPVTGGPRLTLTLDFSRNIDARSENSGECTSQGSFPIVRYDT